jgi:hypothetical protein
MKNNLTNLSDSMPIPENLKYYEGIPLDVFIRNNPESIGTLEAIPLKFEVADYSIVRSKQNPSIGVLLENDPTKGINKVLELSVELTDIKIKYGPYCPCCKWLVETDKEIAEEFYKEKNMYSGGTRVSKEKLRRMKEETDQEYALRVELNNEIRTAANKYQEQVSKISTRIIKLKMQMAIGKLSSGRFLKLFKEVLLENGIKTIFIQDAEYTRSQGMHGLYTLSDDLSVLKDKIEVLDLFKNLNPPKNGGLETSLINYQKNQ